MPSRCGMRTASIDREVLTEVRSGCKSVGVVQSMLKELAVMPPTFQSLNFYYTVSLSRMKSDT